MSMSKTRFEKGCAKEDIMVGYMRALSDMNRYEIFNLLINAGATGYFVAQIASLLKMSSPKVSFHLTRLANYGLVFATRDGQRVYYRACADIPTRLIELVRKGE